LRNNVRGFALRSTRRQRSRLAWLGYGLIACIAILSWVFRLYSIRSDSMLPTLAIGDHLVVSSASYSLKVPFTDIELFRYGEPKRGDVIVFRFPLNESLHYVKRIVAQPGDLVEVRQDEIIVDGKPLRDERVTDPVVLARVVPDKNFDGEVFEEKIGTATHYVVETKRPPYAFAHNMDPRPVPADQYFVAGDNRRNSDDSRAWGFVPRKNIEGKAQVVWMSIRRASDGKLEAIRWDRSGLWIE
jgi:signal peptidase I